MTRPAAPQASQRVPRSPQSTDTVTVLHPDRNTRAIPRQPAETLRPHRPLPGRTRADDLLSMQRLAARTGGTRLLLTWLGERTGNQVRLLDRRGTPRYVLPRRGPATPAPLATAADIERVSVSGPRSIVLTRGNLIEYLVRIEEGNDGVGCAVLSVLANHPTPDGLSLLVGDAARLLGLAWRAEDAQRTRLRMEQTTARGREAVLDLLLSGNIEAAEHIAGALGPRLTGPVHVCVVDCPIDNRAAAASVIERASEGRAWVVPFPLRGDHLIALVPASMFQHPPSGQPGDHATIGALLAARIADCVVAASDVVPLSCTGSGHAQALRRLTQAQQAAEYGHFHDTAAYGCAGDTPLAVLTGVQGTAWARALLAPLETYVPRRRTDPDAAALSQTLMAWLNLGGQAASQLYMHRNTLTARMRLLRDLLGLDLTSIADQAMVHLALRINASSPHVVASRPADAPTAATLTALDELLDAPGVHAWARHELRTLPADDKSIEVETIRVWLANNARLPAAATALGISVPGARKRLTRIERLMSRRLISSPNERHDLWIAMRVRDRTAGLTSV